jgi:hypothetical protein
MRRKLLLVLSAQVAVLVLMSAAASYWGPLSLGWQRPGWREFGVSVHRGSFTLEYINLQDGKTFHGGGPDMTDFSFWGHALSYGRRSGPGGLVWNPKLNQGTQEFIAESFFSSVNDPPEETDPTVIRHFGWKCWITFPFWTPLVLALLYPTICMVHKMKRRRRQREFLPCPACGYNLTGNVSGTCPECGKETMGGRPKR